MRYRVIPPLAFATLMVMVNTSTALSGEMTNDMTHHPAATAPLPPTDDFLLRLVYDAAGVATDEERAENVTPEPDISSCMQDAGFDYEILQHPRPPHELMSNDEYASAYGLGVASFALGIIPVVELANQDRTAGLSQSERDAFIAMEARCLSSVAQPSSVHPAYEVLPYAIGAFIVTVDADPRVQDAETAWAECMERSGHNFATPQQMRAYFYEEAYAPDVDLNALLAVEVQTALANTECRLQRDETVRTVIAERFSEFKSLVNSGSPSTGEEPLG